MAMSVVRPTPLLQILTVYKGGDVKIHQGPSQPFSSYCKLGYINLPHFTLA